MKLKGFILSCVMILSLLSSCKKTETVNPSDVTADQLSGEITLIEGNVNYRLNDKQSFSKAQPGLILTGQSAIKTGMASSAELLINKKSLIRIKENSLLELSRFSGNRDKQNILFTLKKGKILAYPEKINEESRFEIQTHSVTVGIRGTQFTVIADDNKTSIGVIEGKVFIRNQLTADRLDEVQKVNPDAAETIRTMIETGIEVSANESIEVPVDAVNRIQKKTDLAIETALNTDPSSLKITQEIQEDISGLLKKKSIESGESETLFNSREFSDMIDRRKSFSGAGDESGDQSADIQQSEKKQVIHFEKTGSIADQFSEKSTAVTTAGGLMLITNNASKTVYCVSGDTGNLLWKWKDPGINSFNSTAVIYRNQALIAASSVIALISSGKSIKYLPVSSGPAYWNNPFQTGGLLYIPTSETVYQFDGSQMIPLKEIPDSGYFLSGNSKNLILNNALYQEISIYNIKEAAIKWKSDKLQNLSYTPAVFAGKYLIAADSENSLYRFEYETGSSAYESLVVPSGVNSNLISYGSSLYFIANNGGFYKVSVNSWKQAQLIAKADQAPNPDKYLTKKLVLSDGAFYYGTDSGRLMIYHPADGSLAFETPAGGKGTSFAGSVSIIDGKIYALATDGSLYRRMISEE